MWTVLLLLAFIVVLVVFISRKKRNGIYSQSFEPAEVIVPKLPDVDWSNYYSHATVIVNSQATFLDPKETSRDRDIRLLLQSTEGAPLPHDRVSKILAAWNFDLHCLPYEFVDDGETVGKLDGNPWYNIVRDGQDAAQGSTNIQGNYQILTCHLCATYATQTSEDFLNPDILKVLEDYFTCCHEHYSKYDRNVDGLFPFGANWYQHCVTGPLYWICGMYWLRKVYVKCSETMEKLKTLYIESVEGLKMNTSWGTDWISDRTGPNMLLEGAGQAIYFYWKDIDFDSVERYDELLSNLNLVPVESGEGLRPDNGWVFHTNVRAFGYITSSMAYSQVISLFIPNTFYQTYVNICRCMSHPTVNGNLGSLWSRTVTNSRQMNFGSMGIYSQFSVRVLTAKFKNWFVQTIAQTCDLACYENDASNQNSYPLWTDIVGFFVKNYRINYTPENVAMQLGCLQLLNDFQNKWVITNYDSATTKTWGTSGSRTIYHGTETYEAKQRANKFWFPSHNEQNGCVIQMGDAEQGLYSIIVSPQGIDFSVDGLTNTQTMDYSPDDRKTVYEKYVTLAAEKEYDWTKELGTQNGDYKPMYVPKRVTLVNDKGVFNGFVSFYDIKLDPRGFRVCVGSGNIIKIEKAASWLRIEFEEQITYVYSYDENDLDLIDIDPLTVIYDDGTTKTIDKPQAIFVKPQGGQFFQLFTWQIAKDLDFGPPELHPECKGSVCHVLFNIEVGISFSLWASTVLAWSIKEPDGSESKLPYKALLCISGPGYFAETSIMPSCFASLIPKHTMITIPPKTINCKFAKTKYANTEGEIGPSDWQDVYELFVKPHRNYSIECTLEKTRNAQGDTGEPFGFNFYNELDTDFVLGEVMNHGEMRFPVKDWAIFSENSLWDGSPLVCLSNEQALLDGNPNYDDDDGLLEWPANYPSNVEKDSTVYNFRKLAQLKRARKNVPLPMKKIAFPHPKELANVLK